MDNTWPSVVGGIAILIVILGLVSLDQQDSHNNQRASIHCVKAGGTWDNDKEICIAK